MASPDLLAPPVLPTVPPQKGRLLIVDDEVTVLRALGKTLQKQGYETQECISGEKALTALQHAEFDILLCDLLMARMDGLALLRAAHEIAPEVVGVLMTGKSSVESAVAALRAGAFDYVTKPLNLATLGTVLTRAMEVRRLRTENVQLREMVAVYELSTAMAFSLESDTILRKTAEAALRACQADEVSIVLPTADWKAWYVAMAAGDRQEQLIGQVVALEQSIVGWVVRHQEPLLLQGQVQDSRFAPTVPRADIRSALTVPLMAGGNLVGVLNINATKRQRTFTLADQKAASIVASIAAPALVNTQLYQELDLHVQERTAELARANEALRHEEEYFRSLTENALDLVAVLDAEGKIRYVSPSLSHMLGCQPQELAGQPGFSLLHSDDQGRVQEEFARLLTTPGSMANLEYRARHQDGSYRVLESIVHNLLANPAVAGVVINARDITERKEAMRLKEEMVAVVSHELRTPITSLHGFAELLLKRRYPVKKQKEFLTIIHNEAVRLNNLSNDFLDIQRLQAGRMVYHFASVDLAVFLCAAIAPLTHGEEKPAVRLKIATDLPPVQADAARLRQVLENLLSNALKFSPRGGEITVGARREGEHVIVWVTDQGLGIPDEEIQKLFNKFQRVECHATRGIGGSGLGLALAKQVIDAHQGTMWVESEVGKGSTFFFTLPCAYRIGTLLSDDARALSVEQGS